MTKILTVIESPYAGDVEANILYAREAVRDSALRGEAPIASHLLFTQEGIFKDMVPDERTMGLQCGHAWISVCARVAVYADRGVSEGMRKGIDAALNANKEIVFRYIR